MKKPLFLLLVSSLLAPVFAQAQSVKETMYKGVNDDGDCFVSLHAESETSLVKAFFYGTALEAYEAFEKPHKEHVNNFKFITIGFIVQTPIVDVPLTLRPSGDGDESPFTNTGCWWGTCGYQKAKVSPSLSQPSEVQLFRQNRLGGLVPALRTKAVCRQLIQLSEEEKELKVKEFGG